MENQKPDNKKLIFSSEQNNTQKRLEDKGLDLKLAQSDYKKGESAEEKSSIVGKLNRLILQLLLEDFLDKD